MSFLDELSRQHTDGYATAKKLVVVHMEGTAEFDTALAKVDADRTLVKVASQQTGSLLSKVPAIITSLVKQPNKTKPSTNPKFLGQQFDTYEIRGVSEDTSQPLITWVTDFPNTDMNQFSVGSIAKFLCFKLDAGQFAFSQKKDGTRRLVEAIKPCYQDAPQDTVLGLNEANQAALASASVTSVAADKGVTAKVGG
jgi:hypothetical protein